ncbi:recombinase family protein [Klebsiella pneumoniae]|nr:recombinase family protein [Klebsiella pneumoniae]
MSVYVTIPRNTLLPAKHNVMNRPRLYSYIRYSSERQGKGNSLERQKSYIAKMAKQIAEEYKLEVFEEYQDLGVSAYKGKNVQEGALSDFIAQVKSGVIPKGSFLLIESLDRFSRQNAMQAVNLFTGLLLNGITVITGIDRQVYKHTDANNDTFQQLMFSVMLFSRANEESSTKSQRTIASALSKIGRHQQRKPGDHVIAIKELGSDKWWTDSSSGYVNPHPVLFPIAKEIIQLKQDGWSNRMILQHLKNSYDGPIIGNKKSKGIWNMQHCSRILEPAIYGRKVITINNAEYILDDYYPAIISKDEYEALKLQVGNKGFAPNRESNPEIPLLSGIGILYCAHCSCYMVKAKSTLKNHPHAYRYQCASRDLHQDCNKWGFRASTLERTILQLIADRVFLPTKSQPSGLEGKIADIQSQIENYVLAIGSAKSPEIINNITSKIDQLEQEKQRLVVAKRLYDESIVQMNTEGWDKFREFDINDALAPLRAKIRASIKTVVMRVDCFRIDKKHNLFTITYRDQQKQRVVIENNSGWRKGKVYVEVQTINNTQLIESEGFILHDHIDILINRDKFMMEVKKRLENPRTLIDELTE